MYNLINYGIDDDDLIMISRTIKLRVCLAVNPFKIIKKAVM